MHNTGPMNSFFLRGGGGRLVSYSASKSRASLLQWQLTVIPAKVFTYLMYAAWQRESEE